MSTPQVIGHWSMKSEGPEFPRRARNLDLISHWNMDDLRRELGRRRSAPRTTESPPIEEEIDAHAEREHMTANAVEPDAQPSADDAQGDLGAIVEPPAETPAIEPTHTGEPSEVAEAARSCSGAQTRRTGSRSSRTRIRQPADLTSEKNERAGRPSARPWRPKRRMCRHTRARGRA